jgi:hypothetical protein
VPEPTERDRHGRFVPGHRKRGGRRVGSRDKRGSSAKAARDAVIEVERTAEAEGRDPKRAIADAVFDGVKGVHLHGPTPLAFIRALVKEDRDPKRRPYTLKKRQRASPSDTIGPVLRNEPADLGDRDKGRDTSEYFVF